MNHLEDELRALFTERANSVAASPERRASTLGRARTRRRLTAGAALVALFAFAAGTVALLDARVTDDRVLAPAGDGSDRYAFTSTPGEGDVIAHGTFRDKTWELRGERPQPDTGQDGVRLELTIEESDGGATFATDTVVLPSDDVLQMAHAAPDVLGDDTSVVFGATTPGVHSLAIDFRLRDYPRSSITPHRFTGHRQGGITADYYIAFVPRLDLMWLAARNEVGVDLDVETINVDPITAPQIVSGRTVEPGQRFNEGIWWVEWFGRGGACLVLRPDGMTHCFTRSEIAEAGPGLLVAEIETDEVLGVAAVLGEGVDSVRARLEDGRTAILPTVQPPQEDLDEWPLRVVVLGVPPGTSGRLETIGSVVQSYDF